MAKKKATSRPPRPTRPPRTGSAPVEAGDGSEEGGFDPRDLPDPLPLPGDAAPPPEMVRMQRREQVAWDAKEGKPAATIDEQIERGRAAGARNHGEEAVADAQRQRGADIDLSDREAVAAEHERRRVDRLEKLSKATGRRIEGGTLETPQAKRRREKAEAALNRDVAAAVKGGLDEDVARAVAGLAPEDQGDRRTMLENAHDALTSGQRSKEEVLAEVERIHDAQAEPEGGEGGEEGVEAMVEKAVAREFENLKAWLVGDFLEEVRQQLVVQ